MAQAVFCFLGEFSHRQAEFGKEKNWIVTETTRAAFCGDDLARTGSLGEFYTSRGTGNGW